LELFLEEEELFLADGLGEPADEALCGQVNNF